MSRLDNKLKELGYKFYREYIEDGDAYYYKNIGIFTLIYDDHLYILVPPYELIENDNIDNFINDLQQVYKQFQEDLKIIKECEE